MKGPDPIDIHPMVGFPLTELCQTLPVLSQLPSDLLRGLDTSTLYMPSGAIAQMCIELEKQLGYYIVTYRSMPLRSNRHERLHLCRLLVPASLTLAQMEHLQRAEASCHDEGVFLVAYEKPLRLRELTT